MKFIAPLAALISLFGGVAAAKGFHATVYFEVVKPPSDLAPQVEKWKPVVWGALNRHIIDLMDDTNSRIANEKQHLKIKINANNEIDVDKIYPETEFESKYNARNSVQISVSESYKEKNKFVTRTDVYVGSLKGDLPTKKIVYIEESRFREPSRSAVPLTYLFTYAWAMDFDLNNRPQLACPLLAKVREMEQLPDIRSLSGLGPMKDAVRRSYDRLHCGSLIGGGNAP
jgi:hypothetical protein